MKLTVIPPKNNTVILKADTGSLKNYIKSDKKHILTDIKCIDNGPQVILPDGLLMGTTETGILPLNAF